MHTDLNEGGQGNRRQRNTILGHGLKDLSPVLHRTLVVRRRLCHTRQCLVVQACLEHLALNPLSNTVERVYT